MFVTPLRPAVGWAKLIEKETRCIPAYDRLLDAAQGSADWHEQRKQSIGSSEAAAVFPGISTTCTPARLFTKLKSKGTAPPEKFSDYTLAIMQSGQEMEPVLRAECAALLGRPIFETGIFQRTHPALKFMLTASPDGLAVDDHGQCVLTEFKWRASSTDSCDWKGSLGDTVFCQVQHQMFVIGCETAYVYSGCSSGKRALWQVRFSPSYFAMWLAWAKKLEDEVNSDLQEKPRSEAGSQTQTVRFLALEKREHVVQLLPSLLTQK